MENAFKLITKEREKQINVYNYTADNDAKYCKNELENAAEYCLIFAGVSDKIDVKWPFSTEYAAVIRTKSKLELLVIAGGLYLAVKEQKTGSTIKIDSKINFICKEIKKETAVLTE